MATMEERMSFVEGQVVLLPQMIGQVGERLDRAEATLGQRIERVETTLGQRIDRIETTLRSEIVQVGQEVVRLEDKMSQAFYWLLGIQVTTFVTTLAVILGIFYMRG